MKKLNITSLFHNVMDLKKDMYEIVFLQFIAEIQP